MFLVEITLIQTIILGNHKNIYNLSSFKHSVRIHANGDGKEDGVRLYLVLLGDRTKDKNWNTVGIS